MEFLAVFAAVYVLGAAAVLPVGHAVVGAKRGLARWRRGRAAGTKLTTVRGKLRSLQRVRSPMDGLDCAFAVTWFRGRHRRTTVQVFTGNDFIVDTDDGPVIVRAAGAVMQIPFGAGLLIDQPVRQGLTPELQAALQGSPLTGSLALYFVEQVFDDGMPLQVVGVSRMEQAPADLPWRGLRELPVLPTLSAAEGVLDVQVGSEWLARPLQSRSD